jgi:hypothetical protein
MESTEVQTPEGPRIAIYLTVAEAREMLRELAVTRTAVGHHLHHDLKLFSRERG